MWEEYGSKWTFAAEDERPQWYLSRFIAELADYLHAEQIQYASIESLYGPRMAAALQRHFGDRFVLLYVDAPYMVRLQRQAQRENLASIDEARTHIDSRDRDKEQKGVPTLRKFPGQREVIDNAGSRESLHRQIDKVLRQRGVPLSH